MRNNYYCQYMPTDHTVMGFQVKETKLHKCNKNKRIYCQELPLQSSGDYICKTKQSITCRVADEEAPVQHENLEQDMNSRHRPMHTSMSMTYQYHHSNLILI